MSNRGTLIALRSCSVCRLVLPRGYASDCHANCQVFDETRHHLCNRFEQAISELAESRRDHLIACYSSASRIVDILDLIDDTLPLLGKIGKTELLRIFHELEALKLSQSYVQQILDGP